MTFRWQGKTYDSREMIEIETGNPAMPHIYAAHDGEAIFILKVDRLDGAEVHRLRAEELEALLPHCQNPNALQNYLENRPQSSDVDALAQSYHTLLVEDDGRARHALSRLLNHSGYETTAAATIAEAESKMNDQTRHLILDLNLPDGSGKQLLERIRMEKLPIKVAVTTGVTDPAILSEVSELHPDAIFTKPLNFMEIREWIDGTP